LTTIGIKCLKSNTIFSIVAAVFILACIYRYKG